MIKIPKMTLGEWIASGVLVCTILPILLLLTFHTSMAVNRFLTIGPNDLDAQRSMAASAGWMLVVAILSLVATLLGAGLVFMTLREGRRNSIAQLRAYVQVTPGGVTIADDRVSWSVSVENIGITPAQGLFLTQAAHLLRHNEIMDFINSPDRAPSFQPLETANTLGNGKSWSYGKTEGIWTAAEQLLVSELRLDNGVATLLVWGTLHYRDVFGIKRKSNYCYLYRDGKFDKTQAGYHHFHNSMT